MNEVQELENIIEEIQAIEVSDSDDKASVRAKIMTLKKVLNMKLSEAAELKFDEVVFVNYCRKLISSFITKTVKPKTTDELNAKRNSTKGRRPIVKVLSEFEGQFDTSTEALKLAYNNITRSSTLDELRAALKLYEEVQKQNEELIELKESQEWLTDFADEQDKEVRHLKNIKEDFNTVYAALTEDDEKLSIALLARSLNRQGKSEREIAKELKISRTTLSRITEQFQLE